MALTARDRTRYARQLLLPQIGEAGQLRLLVARVSAPPDTDEGALAVATSYLERAGVRVVKDEAVDAQRIPLVNREQLARIAGDPALLEAARALAGALAAVETLRASAGFAGQAQPTVPSLSVLAEDA